MKKFLKFLLPVLALGALAAPALVFFYNRGGISFLELVDGQNFKSLLFPLVGLYAFTLLWLQFLMGSTMWPLQKIFKRIEPIHRANGVIVLLLALLHPGLLLLAVGVEQFIGYEFVPEAMRPYVMAGSAALTIMIITVSAALLGKTKFLKRSWRWIHYANYLMFVLVWTHSWFVGSDVQGSVLQYLWIFYAVTAITAASWRVARGVKSSRQKKAALTSKVSPSIN